MGLEGKILREGTTGGKVGSERIDIDLQSIPPLVMGTTRDYCRYIKDPY